MRIRILASQLLMLLLMLSMGAPDVQAEASTGSLNDIASSDQAAYGTMAENLAKESFDVTLVVPLGQDPTL